MTLDFNYHIAAERLGAGLFLAGKDQPAAWQGGNCDPDEAADLKNADPLIELPPDLPG